MLDRKNVQDILPLSLVQEAVLYEYIRDPHSETNFEQLSILLEGPLDVEQCHQAWNNVALVHNMLRTCFRWVDLKKPVQIILKEHLVNFQLVPVALTNIPKQQLINQLMQEDRKEKFNLEQVPFRIRLYRISNQEHLMVLDNHHILFDGWSLSIILQQFLQQYATPTSQLSRPTASFKDFLQQQYTQSDVGYWQHYLQGYSKDFLRMWQPQSSTGTRQLHTQKWPLATSLETIQEYTRQHKVTLATLFNVCWGMILQRINGRQDVIFDTVRSVRPAKGFDKVAGLFIQTFPVRVCVRPDTIITALLEQLQATAIEQLDKGSVPPAVLRVNGNGNLTFSSILVVENYPLDVDAIEYKLPFRITGLEYQEITKYDLTIVILLMNGQIEVSCTYDQEIIAAEVVIWLGEVFLQLISQVTGGSVYQSVDLDWERFFSAAPPDASIMLPVKGSPGVWNTMCNGVYKISGFDNDDALFTHLGLKNTLTELKAQLPAGIWLQVVPMSINDTVRLLLLCTAPEGFDANALRSALPASMQEHVYDIVAVGETPNVQLLVNALQQPVPLQTVAFSGTAAVIATMVAKVLHLPLHLLEAGASLIEQGIDSFGFIALRNAINDHFQVNISIEKIFTAVSIEGISTLLNLSPRATLPAVMPLSGGALLLSQQQSAMLMHEAVTGNSHLYRQMVEYEIEGVVHFNQFVKALHQLLHRHELLRTYYAIREDVFFATVLDAETFALNDDGAGGSAWFFARLQVIEGGIRFQLQVHHVIADGISMQLLMNELLDLYYGTTLPLVQVNYQHYCYWQVAFRQTPAYTAQRDYYLQQIQGKEALMDQFGYITSTRPPHLLQEQVSIEVPYELATAVKEQCRQYSFTRFQWYTGAFAILMSRYLQREQVFFNIPANGRTQSMFEKTVGLFINTVITRMDVDPQRTIVSQLKHTRIALIQALSSQDYPYATLLQDLNVKGEAEFQDVHNIYLNYLINNVNYIEEIQKGGLTVKALAQEEKESPYKLSCYFYEDADRIRMQLQYNTALFAESDINYILREYLHLLAQCLHQPGVQVSTLDLFSQHRVQQTTLHPAVECTGYFPATAIHQPVHRRFEEIVRERGEQIALKNLAGHQLTYGVLNAAANRLGRILVDKMGLQDEDRVLLLFEQDELEQFVAILGTLKAGGVYVPLDPELPRARMQQIIDDAATKVVLTTRHSGDQVADWLQQQGLQMLYVSAEEPYTSEHNLALPDKAAAPAYILYTSGSSGTPKGVVQAHGHVVHFARAYVNGLNITVADTLLLVAKSNFDAAKMDTYGALLTGATLLVLNVKKDFAVMVAALQEHRVAVFHATPTLYRELIASLPSFTSLPWVRAVVLGGEAVYNQDFQQFKKYFSSEAVFVNGLGPTESTITLQHYLRQHDNVITHTVPVGLPTIDTTVYILDGADQEVPVWRTGEIVYKSPFLALGYWNNKAETQKKFTLDPVIGIGRVYRSGDLGKRLPDGTIVYIGREDTQLKLHGYRIEAGEIEATLDSFPEIQKSVVVLHTLSDNSTLLAAHCRLSGPITEAELKQRLKARLPDYMVPERLVMVATFPLTDTGKIDRKRLTAPERLVLQAVTLFPITTAEKTIATIWADILLLPVSNIGSNYNFFDLGGNSVKLLKLCQQLTNAFQRPVSAKELFACSTVASQAKLLQEPQERFNAIAANRVILENKIDDAKERLKKRLHSKKRGKPE